MKACMRLLITKLDPLTMKRKIGGLEKSFMYICSSKINILHILGPWPIN